MQAVPATDQLNRHDAGTVPPCVHYSISEYGQTLAPVLAALCEWGRTHMQIQQQRRQPRTSAAAPTRPASPPSSAGTTRRPRRNSSPA
ncbi:winged helix-turn-helix transcriptional regulator [Mycolicibacterium fortuitum]|uniref:winged helix-turn-helix transcriptional regulator n=1 Tax=Mycolicibacterium fortuitum TaxID=1766 RepID=UPI002D21D7BB|nr:winged helix-turn-helix transcriptional regulator [Mycolicibacterium fortuitum]